MACISVFDPAMIVWIDESLRQANSTSWSPFASQGNELLGCYCCIHQRGWRCSFVEENVNEKIFTDFVKDSLLPILQPFNCCNPNSIVIMDYVSIHHVDRVAEHIIQTGALLLFLPPYLLDLNKVEQVFSKFKSIIIRKKMIKSANQECWSQCHLLWSLRMTVKCMPSVVDTSSEHYHYMCNRALTLHYTSQNSLSLLRWLNKLLQ